MCQSKYYDKKICFLGDSITKNDFFIRNLRDAYSNSKYRITFINRGIGGCRMDMAVALLADEVFSAKPDYVFINYGVNDVGIWLYDYKSLVTEEILTQRKKRDELFFDSARKVVLKLKENSITPILCSPVCVNEKILDQNKIVTIVDNNEKTIITDSLYTKQTMANINIALKNYSCQLKAIAEELGVEFFDVFSAYYSEMLEKENLYLSDGIHLSKEGHFVYSQIYSKYFDVGDIQVEMQDKVEKIDELVEIERAIKFIKWNIFAGCSEKEIIEKSDDYLLDEKQPKSIKDALTIYLKENKNIAKIQLEIDDLNNIVLEMENKKP